MMTSAQVVETSVNVITNSPSQDYTHPDDHNLPTVKRLPSTSNVRDSEIGEVFDSRSFDKYRFFYLSFYTFFLNTTF